jgi:hypothetical protein
MSTVAVSGMPTRGLLRILGLALGVATVVGGVVGMGILSLGRPGMPNRLIELGPRRLLELVSDPKPGPGRVDRR